MTTCKANPLFAILSIFLLMGCLDTSSTWTIEKISDHQDIYRIDDGVNFNTHIFAEPLPDGSCRLLSQDGKELVVIPASNSGEEGGEDE